MTASNTAHKLVNIAAAAIILKYPNSSFGNVCQMIRYNFPFGSFLDQVKTIINEEDNSLIIPVLFPPTVSERLFAYDEKTELVTLKKQEKWIVQEFNHVQEILQKCTVESIADGMKKSGKFGLDKLFKWNASQLKNKSVVNEKNVKKEDVGRHIVIVDNESRLDHVKRVMEEATIIGLDCEGINLGAVGKLTLVQISHKKSQFLFDVMVVDESLRSSILKFLKQVLENPDISKVIHDCRQDVQALKKVGINLVNIIDVQLLDKEIHNSTQQIGFNELCEKYGVKTNPHKHLGQGIMRTSQGWGKRPLTEGMIEYAAGDVRYMQKLFNTMVSSCKVPQKELVERVQKRVAHFIDSINYPQQKTIPKTVDSQLQNVFRTVEKQKVVMESAQSSATHITTVSLDKELKLEIVNQIYTFLELFPDHIQQKITEVSGQDVMSLIEVVMDKGRPYELFYYHKKKSYYDPSFIVQQEDIDAIANRLSFGGDNRAGIDGSLHRISALPSRSGKVVGLTLRVGRAVIGLSNCFRDFIEQKKSVLLLGKPGSGKTTFIRDFAKNLSEENRVIVVDTSCEIGGFGDVPHVAIGKARRMQVPDIRKQQDVMIQAVQNHTPDIIVIDEIGTRDEVMTTRTISQRGVVLCGSAHGDMKSILKNPLLCDLMGGIENVIVSDRAASSTEGEKMRLQVKSDPIFDVVIQLPDDPDTKEWKIYTDLKTTVQNMLANRSYKYEIRKVDQTTNKILSSIVHVD